MTVQIRTNTEAHRYEILLDGEVVGYADYEDRDGLVAIPHTFVDPNHRGANLARDLVTFALDDIAQQGRGVLPVCPYVQRVIARNRDAYLALVPEADRARFNLA